MSTEGIPTRGNGGSKEGKSNLITPQFGNRRHSAEPVKYPLSPKRIEQIDPTKQRDLLRKNLERVKEGAKAVPGKLATHVASPKDAGIAEAWKRNKRNPRLGWRNEKSPEMHASTVNEKRKIVRGRKGVKELIEVSKFTRPTGVVKTKGRKTNVGNPLEKGPRKVKREGVVKPDNKVTWEDKVRQRTKNRK